MASYEASPKQRSGAIGPLQGNEGIDTALTVDAQLVEQTDEHQRLMVVDRAGVGI